MASSCTHLPEHKLSSQTKTLAINSDRTNEICISRLLMANNPDLLCTLLYRDANQIGAGRLQPHRTENVSRCLMVASVLMREAS